MTHDLLDGVRVVEAGVMLTGAITGMALADLGADVVKIEAPHGDPLRWAFGGRNGVAGPAFAQANRNKRAITADLAQASDRVRVARLIAEADVVIDATPKPLLGRSELVEAAARAVRCRISAFGSDGPNSAIPGWGLLVAALTGAAPTPAGRPPGDDSSDPDIAAAEADSASEGAVLAGQGGDAAVIAGQSAALAVCAALVRRARTGAGADLDLSTADAVLASAVVPLAYQANPDRFDHDDIPRIDAGVAGPRYTVYWSADHEPVAIAAADDRGWRRLCETLARPELADVTDASVLSNALAEVMATRTADQWTAFARAHRLPVLGGHRRASAILDDDAFTARNIVRIRDDEHGPFTYVGSPVVVDGDRYAVRRPAPTLGQHTAELKDGWVDASV